MLSTPIPQIELALKGKVDFLRKTNPWGGGEDEAAQEQKLPDKPQDPDPDVGRKLAATLRGMRKARR